MRRTRDASNRVYHATNREADECESGSEREEKRQPTRRSFQPHGGCLISIPCCFLFLRLFFRSFFLSSLVSYLLRMSASSVSPQPTTFLNPSIPHDRTTSRQSTPHHHSFIQSPSPLRIQGGMVSPSLDCEEFFMPHQGTDDTISIFTTRSHTHTHILSLTHAIRTTRHPTQCYE
jgi:hypothetical protein